MNIFKNLPESVKQSISAVIPLFIVIILFIAVGNFGISKIVDVRNRIVTGQNSEKSLTQKLDILKIVSSELSLKSGLISSVMPGENPSLTVLSQLKILAISNGVILSSIKSTSGSGTASELNQTSVSFSVTGARIQVLSFLRAIAKIAPITVVDKIKISGLGGGVTGDIAVKSYWVDFPKTIPSVSSPVTDLTAQEKVIINDLSAYIQPTFIELAPSQSSVNPNPFGAGL